MKEKKLTPAEKKKREEIAKAIEKDNPNMPMAKKMAIATATAKRVAEYGGPPISRKKYLKQKPMDKELEEKMDEGKMKGAMMRRQDMAKLAGLYSKAMKAIPGSPEQKKIKKMIDQYRRELGMKESLDEGLRDGYIVYKKMGISKIKKVATLKTMPKGKMLDKVLDKYDADGVIAMSKVLRNKMQVEAVDADDTGGEEEVNMAMKQVQAMRHFLDGIESRVKEQGDMEEWYQNKLTKANDYLKTLYSYGKGDKVQEAVSPAQQAAIAISKKERGEKPKNECASEDDFKPHMMYDPKTGKGVMAKKYADHVRLDKMGYTHEKPDVKESRAYRDAMRGLRSKSATRGMATTKKDKDTEASDDDRKAASKNIIMQLRKAADLPTGAEVEFERGKGKVSRAQAQGALARFNALAKPRDKEAFQKSIKSLSDIKKILGR